jgi:hypothetical protein
MNEAPYLAAVAVAGWVLAGAALGDYRGEPDPDENPLRRARARGGAAGAGAEGAGRRTRFRAAGRL